jgi:hypothetical protein
MHLEILYVHPQTTMSRQCIMPFSVPALVKRLPYKVLGLFSSELTTEQIKFAKIIFIDIHWYLGLYGAQQLCKRIKEINPHCKIIAGGITASEYANVIVDKFKVDFVIRGDGEIPFPKLVIALMENKTDFSDIPNLVTREGLITPRTYVLTKNDMEENDYIDIDFFPSFKNEIYKIQKNNVSPWSEVIYPYIIPFRGCPIDCLGCAGGYTEQKKLFGRKPVMRSADKVRDDIERCNADSNIHFVSVYHDFITLLKPDYAFEVLNKKLRVNVRMEFNSKPEMDQLDLVLNRFNGGVINFSIDYMHLTSDKIIEPDHMIRLINRVKQFPNYFTVLSYNSFFAKNNKEYNQGLRSIIKATNCLISDESFYWTEHPIPDKKGYADEDLFDMHIKLSRDTKFVKGPLTRIYDASEPYIPKDLSLGIRKGQQWLVENLPYHLGLK